MKLKGGQAQNQEKGFHTGDGAASASGCEIPWAPKAQTCSRINSENWNLTKATKYIETIYRKSIILCSSPVCTVFPAHLLSAPPGMVHWVKQSDPIQPATHSHCSVWKHMPLTNNPGTDTITEHRTAEILERSSNLLSCLWVESVVHDLLWQMSNLFFKTFKSKLS